MTQRNQFKSLGHKWIVLDNQLTEATADRDMAKGAERARLTKKIQKLKPRVEKARKAADVAYSKHCQAA